MLACPGRVMVGLRGEQPLGGGVVVGLVTGLTALGDIIPLLVEAGSVQGIEEGEDIRTDSGSCNPVTKFVAGREVEVVGRKVEGREGEEVGRRVDAREVEDVGMKVGRMLAGVLVSVKVCCTFRSCGGSCIMLLNACRGIVLLESSFCINKSLSVYCKMLLDRYHHFQIESPNF